MASFKLGDHVRVLNDPTAGEEIYEITRLYHFALANWAEMTSPTTGKSLRRPISWLQRDQYDKFREDIMYMSGDFEPDV